jgi:hypothetical protein
MALAVFGEKSQTYILGSVKRILIYVSYREKPHVPENKMYVDFGTIKLTVHPVEERRK